MLYVGIPCPTCGEYGLMGIRICDGEGHHAVLMCDECESIWLSLDITGKPHDLDLSEYLCPYGDGTLARPEGHWASKEEIQQAGWWDAVIGEGGSMEDIPINPRRHKKNRDSGSPGSG